MPQPGAPQPSVPQPGVPQPGMPQPGMPQPGVLGVTGMSSIATHFFSHKLSRGPEAAAHQEGASSGPLGQAKGILCVQWLQWHQLYIVLLTFWYAGTGSHGPTDSTSKLGMGETKLGETKLEVTGTKRPYTRYAPSAK